MERHICFGWNADTVFFILPCTCWLGAKLIRSLHGAGDCESTTLLASALIKSLHGANVQVVYKEKRIAVHSASPVFTAFYQLTVLPCRRTFRHTWHSTFLTATLAHRLSQTFCHCTGVHSCTCYHYKMHCSAPKSVG